jgi:hypothetical protein
MPEYLAPGVYVEETSYRAKSIEGVGTTTTGFVGPTRTGPLTGHPELLTSFADFERIYGGLEDLSYGVNYLAHGVRAFFEEGGRRCYVMRVFKLDGTNKIPAAAYAAWPVVAPATTALLQARFPGVAGGLRVTFQLRAGRNVQTARTVGGASVQTLTRVRAGDVVALKQGGTKTYASVEGEGTTASKWQLRLAGATASQDLASGDEVYPLTVLVDVESVLPDGTFGAAQRLGEYSLSFTADNSLFNTFAAVPKVRYDWLTIPFKITSAVTTIDQVKAFMDALFTLANVDPAQPALTKTLALTGGSDSTMPTATEYDGVDAGLSDPSAQDKVADAKNGLLAFESVPDISIIAAPGYSAVASDDLAFAVGGALLNHCEKMRYRIAVLDTRPNNLPTEALGYRNLRSSKYGALYYPWIQVADPRPGKSGQRLKLPPSGFTAGIYARNDVENAVFKAPANEVVRLAVDFEQRLSAAHQELLNPNGVNCFRFFEGRGFLLWGARTISDDPEWKYVNVRRYFNYLEASIDRGTQWAVFENNSIPLWNNVRRTIEDFLYNEWRNGGLMGDKPEKAYFVRCDRSTMTQNDLDNGRLVCLIGVAPVKPAEFVIFRIGQWTADSPNT